VKVKAKGNGPREAGGRRRKVQVIRNEKGEIAEYYLDWEEEVALALKWCRSQRGEYAAKIIESYRGRGAPPSRKHILRVLPDPPDFASIAVRTADYLNEILRRWKRTVSEKANELTFYHEEDDEPEPMPEEDEEEDRLLDPEEFPEPEFSGVEKGDVYSLNEAISAWEEEIAEWEGHKPWAAYYTYYVPARCESGLRLCVEADDDDGPWTLDDGGAHEEYADWDDLIGAAEDWYDYLREEAADGRLTKYRRME
jgi:hypothetical protein